MKTLPVKPRLVDYAMFEKRTIFHKINPNLIRERKITYINIIMLLIIIIGMLFLYYRYETKESEKNKTEQKIKDLYIQMGGRA